MTERKRTTDSEGGKNILEEKIKSLLEKVGIPEHLKGYKYLNSAIYTHYTYRLTRNIYAYIAKENGVTIQSVEKDIRYAIKYAWKKGNVEMICKPRYSNGKKLKPSNIEFIVSCSYYLLTE